MSVESANRFLEAAAHDAALRERFQNIQGPDEFLSLTQQLGYSFTTDELLSIVHEQSQGISTRRSTGVWKWLRSINWV